MTPKRTIWITGAGKGIGRALALELARRGDAIVASSRTGADLLSLAEEAKALPGSIRPLPLDVTIEADVKAAVEGMFAEAGGLDIAVLNAGTHITMRAADFDSGKARKLIETNTMSAVFCLDALMKHFISRGSGHIAVVASLAGYRGLPSAAAYSASKAALIALAEGLEPDLAKAGVKLQIVTPGFVATPLTAKNEFPMPFLIPAERAARDIADGLESSRFEISMPRRMKLTMTLLRLLPNRLFLALARRTMS